MNNRIIVITGTLALSMSLSGCLATGQSFAGSGIASMATISEAELNATPTFADEEQASRYAVLVERYREFRQAPDSYLVADGSSTCDLSEAGKWLVTHGKSQQEINALQARQGGQFESSTDTNIESATLIEGECSDGVPEGHFIGVGQYTSVMDAKGGVVSISKVRTRMEGHASDGKMDGEYLFFSNADVNNQFDGQAHESENLMASSAITENGQDIGTHLIVTALADSSGFTTMVRNNRQTALGQQTEVHSYGGSRLTTTVNQLNDVTHGWMTNHLMPQGQQRTCMFHGEMADDARCAGMSLPSVASKPISDDVLEQLVRKDNQGEYMSPYTSDGVLAEWVNMGSSADIGGSVGSGVGAAAGSMIADKALESVPFGSVIGGIFGSKVGEEMGREAGISASGGWENIRATSDRSFDSLTDMARYLAQKYGNEPTYGDAMQVTLQVYPELQNAMASAY